MSMPSATLTMVLILHLTSKCLSKGEWMSAMHLLYAADRYHTRLFHVLHGIKSTKLSYEIDNIISIVQMIKCWLFLKQIRLFLQCQIILKWQNLTSTYGVHHSCILSSCLFNLYAEYITLSCILRIQYTCWAGWITRWNQGCQEKYQESQICRWYHSNGRKWRASW